MPEYVVLQHKDTGDFAAVVPDGTSEDEVVEAWKPCGWSKVAKSKQASALDSLSAPSTPPDA